MNAIMVSPTAVPSRSSGRVAGRENRAGHVAAGVPPASLGGEQGAQHIALVGYTLSGLLLGAAIGGWLF